MVGGKRWLGFFAFDRADLFALIYRAWPVATGPLTLLLIAAIFTPELQGYYFTITAILTLQALLELGLGRALQQITSHEWAHLGYDADGNVTGDPGALTRLATLVRFARTWFALAGVLGAIGLGVGGYFFLEADPDSAAVAWESPWCWLAVLTGLNLLLSPALPILEGCNRVSHVYGFRAIQGIVTRIALWGGMLLGGGLWALVLERGFMLVSTGLFVVVAFGRFFLKLLRDPRHEAGFWQREIWPLQWRFGVVWVSGFLPTLFVPALFALQGSVAAGRIGMTWALVTALLSLSFAVMATKMPRFAIEVARGNYAALDQLFVRSLAGSVVLFVGGALGILGLILVLNRLEVAIVERFLGVLPTALFLGAMFFQLLKHAMATYLRAHKKEPFLVLSLVEAGAMLAILYPLAETYGARGLAWGFFVVAGGIALPAWWIFSRCRKRWHSCDE